MLQLAGWQICHHQFLSFFVYNSVGGHTRTHPPWNLPQIGQRPGQPLIRLCRSKSCSKSSECSCPPNLIGTVVHCFVALQCRKETHLKFLCISGFQLFICFICILFFLSPQLFLHPVHRLPFSRSVKRILKAPLITAAPIIARKPATTG